MRFRPPAPHYSGFIFDCDGTLADTMPLHFAAWRKALSQHRAPFEFTWDLFMKRAGMTQEHTVEGLNAEFGAALDPDQVAEAQRRNFSASLTTVNPIVEVVDYARRVAVTHPIAVASGGERSTVEHTLALLGIRDLFPVVVVSADVVRGKPAPDLFLLAAERMRVAPSQCVVFEDGELGIQAAEAAGMGAVRVAVTAPSD